MPANPASESSGAHRPYATRGRRNGSGALGAVLDARRNEIDIRMDRLRLEMETARLWAQLNFLFPDEAHAGTTYGKDLR